MNCCLLEALPEGPEILWVPKLCLITAAEGNINVVTFACVLTISSHMTWGGMRISCYIPKN